MQAHPIMESSRRWIPVLLMVLVAIGVQAWLLTAYAGVDLLSALVDGAVSIGLVWLIYHGLLSVLYHRCKQK